MSFDSETLYTSEYSIRNGSNHSYVHDERFDCYLITAAFEDKRPPLCSPPEAFDWSLLDGNEIVMANAGFDLAVISRLQELGKIPNNFTPAAVHDVLDLSRYLSFPGNLAGASEFLLNTKADKGVRDKAKGLRWGDMTPDFQTAMKVYAITDAELTLRLWLEHGHKLPPEERELSRMTRDMARQGLPVDREAIEAGIASLEKQLKETRAGIPWAAAPDATVLSKKELAVECRKRGIEPPVSMAKDNEIFDEWLRQHGDSVPFAKAMGVYRSQNIFLKKLQSMLVRTRPDGWMGYGLKFFGGHTGRDSGDSGVNIQNLSRTEVFGVDMRGMIKAPAGFKLGVIDLVAIEPCCLSLLSGDDELAQLLRDGMDVYEAQARIDGEYDGEEPLKTTNPKLRQFNKLKVLSCAYGAGAEKVQSIGKKSIGLELSLAETTTLVAKFRARKFIPALWRKLEEAMRRSAGGDFHMELPSGRSMIYRQVRAYGSLSAVLPRNGKMMRLKTWGGSLVENCTQAAARDVLMEQAIRVEKAGFNIVARMHDELVVLLPDMTAEADLAEIVKIMSTPPSWWPELPVRADGFLTQKYCKP